MSPLFLIRVISARNSCIVLRSFIRDITLDTFAIIKRKVHNLGYLQHCEIPESYNQSARRFGHVCMPVSKERFPILNP